MGIYYTEHAQYFFSTIEFQLEPILFFFSWQHDIYAYKVLTMKMFDMPPSNQHNDMSDSNKMKILG